MRLTGGFVFDQNEGFVRRDVCFDGPLLECTAPDCADSTKKSPMVGNIEF
ncbi:hypothetical protein I310019A7_09040 [Lawsonibacter asaccharolyticus]